MNNRQSIPWVCLALLASATAHAQTQDDKPLPRMVWDKEVICTSSPAGDPVRIQCDDKTKVCLTTSGCVDGRGTVCRPMERLQHCRIPRKGLWASLEGVGYRFERGIAEAPPGWMRDRQGRIFQYNFDLNRRIWLGARYPFAVGPGDRLMFDSITLDSGFRVEWMADSLRTRYRLKAFESTVRLNPLAVDATLLELDTSHESMTPLFRLTTFWPEPERHDLHLNMGFWGQLGKIEYHARGSDSDTVIRIAGAGVTMDFWHSVDMSSYVRLRLAVAADAYHSTVADERYALTPIQALETDLTLDRDGFHHLGVQIAAEQPLVLSDKGLMDNHIRGYAKASYEVVLLAINDQPLSAYVGVGGGYRDDLLGVPNGWEFNADAGFRFSLWVPSRDLDAMERAAKRLGKTDELSR